MVTVSIKINKNCDAKYPHIAKPMLYSRSFASFGGLLMYFNRFEYQRVTRLYENSETYMPCISYI